MSHVVQQRQRLLVAGAGEGARSLAGRLGASLPTAVIGATSRDPFGIAHGIESYAQAHGVRPDGAVVVASKRRSAQGVVPAPVIDGVPVGIVFADSAKDAELSMAAGQRANCDAASKLVEPCVVVASMYNPEYENLVDGFLHVLDGRVHAVDLRARHYARESVVDALAAGPEVLVYVGHGRWRGWSGYRGLGWDHIDGTAVRRAAGVVISLSCDALKRPGGKVSFGEQLVRSGRAAAFVGSPRPLRTDEGFQLVDVMAHALAERPRTVGELLVAACKRSADTATSREFDKLRLIGLPSEQLALG